VIALLLTGAQYVRAEDEPSIVKEAARLLEQIASDPESGIPAECLREASGILIMPHVVDKRFGLGRKRGQGIFLSRNEDSEWGEPQPVAVSGVSVGAEMGREVGDRVIIFRTRKAAEKYSGTNRTLSFTIGVYGSIRRKTRFLGPPANSDEEVLVYERFRGLRVGAAIGGERRFGPSIAASDRKTKRPAEPEVAEAKAQPTMAHNPSSSPSSASPVIDSPDTVQLKRLLKALTVRAPAPVVSTTAKDVKVKPAGATTPLPASSASPR
jgi:lipid-binding SYLF domain-containing protein